MRYVPVASHVHDDDLDLYMRGQLELQHTSTVSAHLIHCETCQGRLSQSLGSQLKLKPTGQTNAKGKYERSELRFSSGDSALLQELTPLSSVRHLVTIVDISRNGIGIISSKPTPLGTIVHLRINESVELGEVRNCKAEGVGWYRIGLRLHWGI
jgi:hypothetical protein